MRPEKSFALSFELIVTLALFFGLCLGAKAEETVKSEIKAEVVDKKPIVEDGIMAGIEDLVRRADLHAIFDKDFERQDIGGKAYWERRMEPSFRQGHTTLIDDYGLQVSLHPKFLQYVRGNWVFGPSASGLVRFQFARQFDGDHLKDLARIAVEKVYTPFSDTPLTVAKAKKLPVDSFFSFQAHLNLMVSGSQLTNSTTGLNWFPEAHYLMSGEFQIHLYRIDENHFDLKLIGIRDENVGAGVKLGYEPDPDLHITRVEFADKILLRRLRFVPFELNFELPKSNLYMVHYKLDLSEQNTDVIDAYNSLFDSLWNLRTLKILDPRKSATELRDLLLADVTLIEDIFEKERDKAVDVRKVDRVFRGENDVIDANGFSMSLGHEDIFRFSFSRNYSENFITMTNRENEKKYFYMPLFNIFDSNRGLLGLWDEATMRTANLLFETDENKRMLKNDDQPFNGEMSFNMEYRDKKLRPKEIRNLKNFIKIRVPRQFYDEIDWRDWVDERERTNARITVNLVFRPGALAFASDLPWANIWERYVKYLESLPYIAAAPTQTFSGNLRNDRYVDQKYYEDVEFASYRLAKTFNSSLPSQERVAAFVELRNNPLFQEVGSGFLSNLLESRARELKGEDGIKDVLKNSYFETTWEAKSSDTIHIIKGDCQKRPLYKAVMYIYSLLNNRSMDMRLVQNEGAADLPDKAKDPSCQ